MSVAVAQLARLKAAKNLANKDIAAVCGVTPAAVTELFQGRMKNMPLYWIEALVAAYDLDANYFFRKDAPIQNYQNASEQDFRSIPLLGNIAASFGRNSEELPDEGFLVPNFMLPKKRPYFALRVSGDSMEGAGILDGDICIIEKQENTSILKSGDIAAFRVDGDTTLKYYQKSNGHTWLSPANPKYQPIPLNAGMDIQMIGQFVSLLRPPS